jgi:hypothetical protein
MDLLPNEQNFDLDNSRQKFHHSLKEHHKIRNISKFRCEMLCKVCLRSLPFFQSFCITHGKLIPLSEKRYINFPVRDTKWLKNGKLRRAILSAFYNISQRNFGILLILWCSFKLWWNVCLDLLRSKFCSVGNQANTIFKKKYKRNNLGGIWQISPSWDI